MDMATETSESLFKQAREKRAHAREADESAAHADGQAYYTETNRASALRTEAAKLQAKAEALYLEEQEATHG